MAESHAAEIQAELQQYLTSKNINALFVSIVENLLIEKPSNPIAFTIEYLTKTYPDQAKVALDNIIPRGKQDSKLDTLPTSPDDELKLSQVDSHEKKKESGVKFGNNEIFEESINSNLSVQVDNQLDSENGSDVDEETYSEFTPVLFSKKSPKSKSRRSSVSAESADPNKLKEQLSQIETIPKEPHVMSNLLEVVSKSPLFRALDSEQKEKIVNAFSGPVSFARGENIITQGDDGKVFYLLEQGEVEVYINNNSKPNKGTSTDVEEVLVHTYKSGDSFGELAIMYNTPRAATCRAKTDCMVWALDRTSFKAIVVSASMIKRETYQQFLKGVPILESLTDMEIMTLADVLVEENFHHNDKICTQGEEGNYFYIIKSGSAICTQYNEETDDEKIVANLVHGNYFGEIALLTNKPRQATVIAQEDMTVLAIDRATFTRIFGSLDEILKRNIDQYTKYSTTISRKEEEKKEA